MKNDELLPCPFCGSKDIIIDFCDPGCCNNVRSLDCKCGVYMSVDCSEEKAIEAWNTRTEPSKEQDVCPTCEGSGKDGDSREYPPNEYVCESCNGTGKAPVDNILEAFDIPYQLRMIHSYKDGWLPEEKAHEIAMIGYNAQQAELERLEKRLSSSENNEQILYTEIEFLKCCGNCKNKHKCATASGEQCEDGNWQPKESK